MGFARPDYDRFASYFSRDFVYGATEETVTEDDIVRALGDAEVAINEALFGSQAEFDIGYLNLTAHYLVMNIRASSQGINGSYPWMIASKGVGSVSESFQIPAQISDNPQLAMLAATNYGARYLSLVLPKIVGQVFTVLGTTQP